MDPEPRSPSIETIAGLLADAARRGPARIAFEQGPVLWTYAEVARRSADLARTLAGHGVRAGDAVAWIGDNGPSCAWAYFGAAWAGAVLVPLHLRLLDQDLVRVLAHAQARVVLTEPASAERARGLALPCVVLDGLAPASDPRVPPRAPVEVPSEAPAHLYYTSGSTGAPKGVVLTHRNVTSHARLAAQALDLTAADVWLHAAPMFHLADAWATFAITGVLGRHRFVPRFHETEVLAAFASGVTVTNLVPTMWNALVRHPLAREGAYPSLRLLLSGGSAIAPDLVGRVRRTFGAEYAQTYGLTETSPYLTINRLRGAERALPEDVVDRLLARAGRPMEGVDVRVVNERLEPVPPDGVTVGEVVARGPTVTPGYLRNPEADALAFRDGWFRTGDLARLHRDGRIDLADRAGDVVNSGGEKVFSTDVERALADLPGVRELCVVGTPDPHWGSVVTAAVVPEGAGTTLEAMQAHARSRLADFKVPRRLVLLAALPRTPSGKISKRDVRALATAALEPRRG